MARNNRFRGNTKFENGRWTVEFRETRRGYFASATADTEEEARAAAKAAMREEFAKDGDGIPLWLNE